MNIAATTKSLWVRRLTMFVSTDAQPTDDGKSRVVSVSICSRSRPVWLPYQASTWTIHRDDGPPSPNFSLITEGSSTKDVRAKTCRAVVVWGRHGAFCGCAPAKEVAVDEANSPSPVDGKSLFRGSLEMVTEAKFLHYKSPRRGSTSTLRW